MLTRRDFLWGGGLFGAAAITKLGLNAYHNGYLHAPFPVSIYNTGMPLGHQLRQKASKKAITWDTTHTIKKDVVIVGSGAAGLFCAWQLHKAGFNNFVLIEGPEPLGNAHANQFNINNNVCPYPTGAHYLPLPAPHLHYIRQLLADMGILKGDISANAPEYDERYIVHAPESRIWVNGHWQAGCVPELGIPAHELAEQNRFFNYVEQLKTTKGRDNKPVFNIPIMHSSQDPAWLALDKLSFKQWLQQNNYSAPSLLWYLNYACKDDYGLDTSQTSAWAGLHYFASREGLAKNAQKGAVITWPQGMAAPLGFMANQLSVHQKVVGMALQVQENTNYVLVQVQPFNQLYNNNLQTITYQAKHVVMACPLHVCKHLLYNFKDYAGQHLQLPQHQPWLVSNFLMYGYPTEQSSLKYNKDSSPLAWDNTIYGSPSLGFVNSTNQLIRAAKPEYTVLSCYHVFTQNAADVRQWMMHTLQKNNTAMLLDIATQDLNTAYNQRWRNNVIQAELTLRAHGMAAPTVGFKSNPTLLQLQQHQSRVCFAHSDLSGYSIFEEAAYWGFKTAQHLLSVLAQ